MTGVYIKGSTWSSTFLNYLGANGYGSSTFGYELQTGSTQLNVLPWTTINTLTIQFSGPVTLVNNTTLLSNYPILIGSSSVAAPPTANGVYSSATDSITWTFGSALTSDRYRDLPAVRSDHRQ